jgi:sirohydrochlorin ferrochelatase
MSRQDTAIIVFAHGSMVEEANDTIARLATGVSRASGLPASAAFLEVAHPDLHVAVGTAVRAGARRILIIPCFLVFGVHVRQDLPRLVKALVFTYPDIEIVVSQPLEGHPGLAEILANRVSEALAGETLAVAGREKG